MTQSRSESSGIFIKGARDDRLGGQPVTSLGRRESAQSTSTVPGAFWIGPAFTKTMSELLYLDHRRMVARDRTTDHQESAANWLILVIEDHAPTKSVAN